MNQNQSSISKKGLGIKKKIEHYMSAVSIDLFSYEKMVNTNIVAYAQTIAKTHGVSFDQVFVRITKPRLGIRVFLHVNGKFIKELTIIELVEFFLGYKPTKGLQDKIVASIDAFLKSYVLNSASQTETLQVLISSTNQKAALIKIFDETDFIEDIPVKTLVHFFKA